MTSSRGLSSNLRLTTNAVERRCLVSTGGRHAQLNLRARIELTPDSQLTSISWRVRACHGNRSARRSRLHQDASRQSLPLSRTRTEAAVRHTRISTSNPLRLCVLKGIAQRFPCDP